MQSEVRSILIVLMGSIGDVVRGLAIVAPIKQAYPSARITWLVEPTCSSLVREHALLDEVLVFNRKQPLRGLLKLISELRSRHFDVCLDLQRHFKSGAFSWLSGARKRIGFHRKDAKELNWIFQTDYIEQAPQDLAKILHYLSFLPALGITAGSELRFGLAEKEQSETVKQLRSTLGPAYVVFVLGSSWQSKDWLLEGYQKLVEYVLSQSSYRIALCGDQSQITRAAAIMAKQSGDRVIDLVGKTSLVDLAYILKDASACVGPDSGPAHIAAAVGTPHVTLFGPTSPARVAPFGSENLSLQSSLGCTPCYRKKCPGLDRLCMRLLSPEAAWNGLQAALARKSRAV
ncbi:MAG: glycosyltransferase family 9 protein [Deltaproteobacteria bacterium]|nr:glycosyltransferase family 9 protein [Deltaproteobacteria bacterium]